jgi:Tol biopolymer transport system component
MRSIFVSLLAVVSLAAAAPVFAAESAYYGARVNVSTIYDDTDHPSNTAPDADFLSYTQKSPEEFPEWFYSFLQVELHMGQESPVWMPDGNGIAFSGFQGNGIYTVPVDGGKAHLVYCNWHTPGTNPERESLGSGDLAPLCYTPDGKEITYREYIYDAARGSYNDGGSIGHLVPVIRCVNVKTGAVRTLVEEATDGYWSPDGRYFAYISYGVGSDFGKNFGVKLLDVQTGEKSSILPGGYSVCFTPDSKYLVYCKLANPADVLSWNLFRMSIPGGESEQITFFDKNSDCYDPRDPSISPSGEWILFTGRFKEMGKMYQGLCVLNTKTGKTFKAFPKSEVQSMSAKWSPDGNRFVYMTQLTTSTIPSERLYIFDFQPTPFQKPTTVENTAASPAAFALTGNFPNPFNPSTTIAFTVPSAGNVQLAVFDITGQKVRELVSGPVSAGSHSVVWDGRDAYGRPVSSGVYLSRLTMGNRTTAGRMLLAK